jgi:N-methylhydantoinase A
LAKQPSTTEDVSGVVKRERQVYFKGNGGFVATPCYDGDRLSPGNVIKGPAIIEETKTTVVVPPGGRIEVDIYGNYVAELS